MKGIIGDYGSNVNSSKSVVVSAPGKIILSGEHSVVYGYPALLSATSNRLSINNNLEVVSNIPIGCGMGSSATYSVAISAIKMKLTTGRVNFETIENKAYAMEKSFHGNPSGADISVCINGGYLWFRKETETIKVFTKIKPKKNFQNMFLHNTGKPSGKNSHLNSSIN